MSDPLRSAWLRFRLEALVWYVHRRTLLTRRPTLRRLAAAREIRLHLGCGANLKAGWINVDIHPAADLRLDLRRRWPFADGSAAEVYAEHFFEHLTWPGEADGFLAEARRVLRPGGLLRLSVPDMARHVRAYLDRDEGFRRLFAPFLAPEATTWGDVLNHHFRQQGEHRYVYDRETLTARLEAAGFAGVRAVPPERAYEQSDRHFESLVVTARRP